MPKSQQVGWSAAFCLTSTLKPARHSWTCQGYDPCRCSPQGQGGTQASPPQHGSNTRERQQVVAWKTIWAAIRHMPRHSLKSRKSQRHLTVCLLLFSSRWRNQTSHMRLSSTIIYGQAWRTSFDAVKGAEKVLDLSKAESKADWKCIEVRIALGNAVTRVTKSYVSFIKMKWKVSLN